MGEWTAAVDDLPELSDLVSEVKDMSETKVYFAAEPAITENYADQLLTIVVEDASGNKTEGECLLSFRWMAESVTLELGTELTREMLLIDPERDEALIDQEELDKINSAEIGEYTVLSITPAQKNTCVVTVQDTTGPELLLKEVQRLKGKKVKLEDFIELVEDLSGVADVRMLSEYDINVPENYPIVIEAEDTVGNITRGETVLHVTTDITPPEFKGKLKAMSVAKHSSPDFLTGVTAEDKVDGPCKVTVDTSKLDMDTAGTYYITYKASDKSGNVKTVKRKVIVEHDAEDTAALVKKIADSLGNDPEKLRDYVRSKINYNHDWGGNDPVWYGFTTKNGNCYVHAMCLKAIFDLKGIENQLIWVTNKSHYWLIVKIDGKWKHIDPTPSDLHGRYSLMNDEQRLSTLSGRTWDTSKWPACE